MKQLVKSILWVMLLLPVTVSASETDEAAPYLYILGVAQDAGYPQAGCFKPHCMPGWQDPGLRRGATSLAVILPQTKQRILFEATPQFPQQYYALELQAPAVEYALAGVLLTHAHIGHYAGLMYFGHEAMGASKVPVYAMPRMAAFLRQNGPWSQLVDLENITLRTLTANRPEQFGGIRVTPFVVPHRDEFSETVGFRIDGPQRSALFIPDIDSWESLGQDLAALVSSVDYALLDATFFSGDELPGRDISQVPHPLVTDTMARLGHLPRAGRAKVWFIHLNHTNPLLDPDSEETARVLERGFNIAHEKLKLAL